jgi:hypothetical protein
LFINKIVHLRKTVEMLTSDESQVHSLCCAFKRVAELQKIETKTIDIHVLGADEVELLTLDRGAFCSKWNRLFRRIAEFQITTLRFLFIGPNMTLAMHEKKVVYDSEVICVEGRAILRVEVEASCELYHEYRCKPSSKNPFLVIAYNAGIWGYDSWLPSLHSLFSGWGDGNSGYFVVTSYTREESEDDYDTIRAYYDEIRLSSTLRWVWDCEENEHKCSQELKRVSLDVSGGHRAYYENNFWQCITLE